jgi:hypothetical protein
MTSVPGLDRSGVDDCSRRVPGAGWVRMVIQLPHCFRPEPGIRLQGQTYPQCRPRQQSAENYTLGRHGRAGGALVQPALQGRSQRHLLDPHRDRLAGTRPHRRVRRDTVTHYFDAEEDARRMLDRMKRGVPPELSNWGRITVER